MILVGYKLDHVLDHMIMGLVTTALHQRLFKSMVVKQKE